MKTCFGIILILCAALLTACNFSLAADVTPPPEYIPPTPMPTLGPLFPARAPDTNNGAAIYAEKCSPCHGKTGLGDGAQGKQLPVPVAAFALPETAGEASPVTWFTMVSQGNLDRFMPPFTSLNEQERWDVIAYALTLHTTAGQIEAGKKLFDSNCPGCAGKFDSQEKMSALSENDLIRIIKKGEGDIPAFGSGLSDEEAAAVAAYIRTLTFAPPPATPTVTPATEVPPTLEAGTPSAAETAVEGTQAAATAEPTNLAGTGKVSGLIDNQTGRELPAGLKITLRGFEHGSDPSTGATEVRTLEGIVNPDGSYVFDPVDLPPNRIFIAELNLDDITYQTDFAVVEAGKTEIELPALKIYNTTQDYSALQIKSIQMYFDYANEQNVQLLIVYSIENPSNKTVVIKDDGTKQIPFIKLPDKSQGTGYQATQDSAPFITLADGFAMPPSDGTYGLIATATMPKDNKLEIVQPVVLSVGNVTILVPEGVTAKGDTLANGGTQDFQGGKFNLYTSDAVEADQSLSFTLIGAPKNISVSADVTQNKGLLIGIGALGLVLILAGVWLYWRDRNRLEDEEGEQDDLEDSESIMDAIIALDDLHRAGKIPDEAYNRRRDELKNRLKR